MQSSLTPSLPLRFFAFLLIVVAVFSLAPEKIHAQCGGVGQIGSVTNSGREFMVCFMKNEGQPYDQTPSCFEDIYIALVDTNLIDTVRIKCKAFPTLDTTFYLDKINPSAQFRVTTAPEVNFPTNDGVINSDEVVDNKVFSVVATSPISCYGMNNKFETADAFIALPKQVASTEYRIMSYQNSNTGLFLDTSQQQPSEFCIAAFNDNTSVTITPSDNTEKLMKDDSETFILNAGQCVQVLANLDKVRDLTGSRVSANNLVAVYGGHARAVTPLDWARPSDGGASRDHLAESMPPVSSWGSSFIAKNEGDPQRPIGDTIRVLAAVKNTVVKINGVKWGLPFNANEYRDTGIGYYSKVAEAGKNIFSIESDDSTKHLLVGMITHSAFFATGEGDPDLVIIPPVTQSYNDFTYFISTNVAEFPDNFLIVTANQKDVGEIAVDGLIIPAKSFTPAPSPVNNTNYSVVTIGQTGGPHRIQAPVTSNFLILAYGLGPFISYSYTAGSLYKPTTGIMSLSSPNPNIAPGPGHHTLPPPSIVIRNITNERVYFDSARVTYSQNMQNNTVRLKKDIALDVGFIEMAEEKTLELTTSKPVEDVITGNIRIWYHSAKWFDMYPVDFPFTITPQQVSAGVNDQNVQSAYLENYPNPSSGRTTVHFWLPSRANVSVKIYDALGRTVRKVMQGMTNGEETLQVSTKGLPAGDYTLELLAPELGISKHTHVVVIE